MYSRDSFNGSYALVTGASQGLGKEFAVQLAALGMNLILVARDSKKLAGVAEVLRTNSPIEVHTIELDLTARNATETLKAFLKSKSIRIRLLVNNAGTGSWGPFEAATPETYAQMIDLNMKVPVLLSQLLFEDLRSNKGSAIINVSSLASLQPIPFMAVYAATKSFMTQFSFALWNEWEKHGVYVQTLMPGAINTEFDAKSGGFQAPFKKDQPEAIVRLSLTELFDRRRPVVYAKKSVSQRIFARLLPRSFLVREVAKVFTPKSQSLP